MIKCLINVWWIKTSWLKEVLQRNHRLQESYNVKKFKEIKRLKYLLVKVEAYLEPERASTMEFFCEYI